MTRGLTAAIKIDSIMQLDLRTFVQPLSVLLR